MQNQLQEKQEKSNEILETIGSFDIESAIGKLQMLHDKKIISGLDYTYREEKPTEKTNGNPMWFCQCKVDGVDEIVEYGDIKKIHAKKLAAFTMLQILTTGRDKVLESLAEKVNLEQFSKGGGSDE